MKNWEEILSDFKPDDLFSFELTGKEVFYFDISKPTTIRGAFATDKKAKIKVKIEDPAR